jgi:hypothetical protein
VIGVIFGPIRDLRAYEPFRRHEAPSP